MGFLFAPEPKLVDDTTALPGRPEPVLANPRPHAVLTTPITGPWREGQKRILIGIGCFWGAEKMFWQLDGVESTSVGYGGGITPNPTYREVCSGQTNHVELVEVVYDPEVISLKEIVKTALEAHDPTQGYRQGNDVGTQYRSAMFYQDQDQKQRFQNAIDQAQQFYDRPIVTTLEPLSTFFPADNVHQDFYSRNPGNGYCSFVIDPKLAQARRQWADWIQ